ncbi:MAG: DUF5329 family protein [Pseudomonas sp.]
MEALLAFVENSRCKFVRNGSEYSPKDARAHLQKKLEHLEKKGLVDSARVYEFLCNRPMSGTVAPDRRHHEPIETPPLPTNCWISCWLIIRNPKI